MAFASVARATGLAAATLVQRFGSREAMVLAALQAQWDRAEAVLARADLPLNAKGAVALLKTLPDVAALVCQSQRHPALRARAHSWRGAVLSKLAAQLGGGAKGAEAAAAAFALWQGQSLWKSHGDKGFRLKDTLRRLT